MPRPKTLTPSQKSLLKSGPPLKTRGVYASVKLEPVPFDSAVDCPPYGCFNCRELNVHLSKDCPKSILHEYCINCGRRGLDVYNCPRCGKGYIEYFGAKPLVHVKIEEPVIEVSTKKEKKLPVGMTPLPKKKKAKESSSLSSQVSSEKKLVQYQSKSNSPSDSAIDRELGDEFFSSHDNEDLDRIIVDEDEISVLQQPVSDIVHDFVNLIKLVKHLPMKTQNMVALQFVEEQRVLLSDRKFRQTSKSVY